MAREPFTVVRGVAAPLPLVNVSTDDLFPSAGANKRMPGGIMSGPDESGPNAFGNMRYDEEGVPRPEFILNRPPWNVARILIAGDNFGCGSSRESAVWGLMAIGLRCVIAPSFGDIFYQNCIKNGLLPVRLRNDAVEHLLAQVANPATAEIEVDLVQEMRVVGSSATFPFEISPYSRSLLVGGLDEIGESLRSLPVIEQYETSYRDRRPWLSVG